MGILTSESMQQMATVKKRKALHQCRDHGQQNTDNRPVGRPEAKQSTALGSTSL